MALSDIVPINRKEEFLQAIADKSGAPSPVTRIEEFLKRISESSSLPEVTSDDNGDFLGVVNGEWDKVPAPSSLPPYTAADKDKLLGIGEGEPAPSVIVPEQTVEYTGGDGAGVTGADFSNVAVGTSGVMTVNGTDYNVVAALFDGLLAFMASEGGTMLYVIGNTPDGVVFQPLDEVPGNYTISLTATVPSVKPMWKNAGVMIIHCTGTAQVGAQSILVPTDTTLNDVLKCLVNAGNNDNRFTKPVYVNLPDVNTVTGAYSYADHSYMALASLDAIRGTVPIYETAVSSYTLYAHPGTGTLNVIVASK